MRHIDPWPPELGPVYPYTVQARGNPDSLEFQALNLHTGAEFERRPFYDQAAQDAAELLGLDRAMAAARDAYETGHAARVLDDRA